MLTADYPRDRTISWIPGAYYSRLTVSSTVTDLTTMMTNATADEHLAFLEVVGVNKGPVPVHYQAQYQSLNDLLKPPGREAFYTVLTAMKVQYQQQVAPSTPPTLDSLDMA